MSLYKRAANRAPRPRRLPPIIAGMLVGAAAPLELLELAEAEEEPEPPDPPLPPAVAEAPLLPPEAAPPEPEAAVAPLPPLRTTVVELPTLTVNEESVPETFSGMVVRPVVRPFGMVATAGCDVTTAGCVVTALADLPVGLPVTTPAEFVSVK